MLSPFVRRSFTLFVAGVFLAFLLPRTVQDGMFMDGQLYATVAHNQAGGYGTFWEPRFSQVGFAGSDTFHEHPPLFFGLQSLWFRLLGSGFWVERSFSFLMALLIALLMLVLWRELLSPERPEHALGMWAILLWVIIPTSHWCVHNNMIENAMAVFTTAAVFFVARGLRRRLWVWGALAAIAVFLASMTKGLPGLFPLATPVLLWWGLRHGSFRRAFVMSVLMTSVVVLCYVLLLQHPEARANLVTYVERRLLHRISSVPTVEYRAATLEMLMTNMIGPLALSIIVILLARRQGPQGRAVPGTPALALALVGLSGVLPLMLTMVQKSFYMGAALPLCAMACALWSAPALARIAGSLDPRGRLIHGVRLVGLAGIVGAIGASLVLFGTAGRDKDLLQDVHRIGSVLPPFTKAGLPGAMWNEWALQGYLMRYHYISVDDGDPGATWFITAKSGVPRDTAAYVRHEIGLVQLDLWRRR